MLWRIWAWLRPQNFSRVKQLSAKMRLAAFAICLCGWFIPAEAAAFDAGTILIMPPQIYAVCGRECNLYFDNLFPGRAEDYSIDVNTSGNLGAQENERFTVIPGELSKGTLQLNVFDRATGELLSDRKTILSVAPADAHNGENIKVILIGDSLINAGIIGQTLLNISSGDPMKITLEGTRGTAANRHEGRGGWKIADYAFDHPDNPFWFGDKLDFAAYLEQNAIETPDWVFIELGTNDIFHKKKDLEAAETAVGELEKLDLFISSVKAAGDNIKIGLMIAPPPASDQDAFGANYGVGQTRDRFKRNILIWASTMIEKYAGRESEAIYLVPVNTALDTRNNMITVPEQPANSRSSVLVIRQNNGIHPSSEGYRQIADALWAFLKNSPQ